MRTSPEPPIHARLRVVLPFRVIIILLHRYLIRSQTIPLTKKHHASCFVVAFSPFNPLSFVSSFLRSIVNSVLHLSSLLDSVSVCVRPCLCVTRSHSPLPTVQRSLSGSSPACEWQTRPCHPHSCAFNRVLLNGGLITVVTPQPFYAPACLGDLLPSWRRAPEDIFDTSYLPSS